jgi:hypothetical protein
MKNIITIGLIILSLTITAQNKNMSFGLKTGATKLIIENDKNGVQLQPQLNFHFLKNKRANITTTLFYNAYNIQLESYKTELNADGTYSLVKIYEPVSDKYVGFALSSQIKILNLEKKIVPYIQPQLLFYRELISSQESTFGGTTITPDMFASFNLSIGASYKKRVQMSLFYEFLFTSPQNLNNRTPSYSYGINLSYLFNISFKKKAKEE